MSYLTLANTIEPDSTHLRQHGTYIDDQYDERGRMWERVLQVSDAMARAMLWEASRSANPNESTHYDTCVGVVAVDIPEAFLPQNKAWVVFQHDGHNVWAVYRHDWKTYIVRCELKRLQRYYAESTPSLFRTYLKSLR